MVPFGPWLPDAVAFSDQVATVAENVTPSGIQGFRPAKALLGVSGALTDRPVGAAWLRSTSNNVFSFAGLPTSLQRLSADGLTFTDVSRVIGGAYATPVDGWWSITSFGDYAIACNGADDTQVYQMGASSNFAALPTAPKAYFAGTIRDFVVLARIATAANRIQWSGINDHTAWTPSATTMSDYQDFPDGGAIKGFVGGEYGLVFQERAIQRMSFEGPPLIFRFDKIATNLGVRVENSIASYSNLTFFLSHDGFYMVRGGSEIVPIGEGKIDRWLADTMDPSYVYRCSSAIDPNRKLYAFSFPSTASAGIPDTILLYHWPSGRWTYLRIAHDLIYTGVAQGSYTIDGLSALSATIDGLTYPPDSFFYTGTGQLQMAGFDTAHKHGFFSGQNLQATVETGDVHLSPGRKSLLRSLRPMIEGANSSPFVTVRSRDRLQSPLVSGLTTQINDTGFVNVRSNARYHRAQITIPQGDDWTDAIGIDDVKFSTMGAR